MPEYLAPGVYVEEVSFRSKSIEGVGTSTTAFVGPTLRGPVGGMPELLTSFSDFERIYGGLDDLAASSDPMLNTNYVAHAVRAYFNNGGARLYVVRAFAGDAAALAAATASARATPVLTAPAPVADPPPDPLPPPVAQVWFTARAPGAAFSAAAVSVHNVATPTGKPGLANAPDGSVARIHGTAPPADPPADPPVPPAAIATVWVKDGGVWKKRSGGALAAVTQAELDGVAEAYLLTATVVFTPGQGEPSIFEGLGLAKAHPRSITSVLADKPARRTDDLTNPIALHLEAGANPDADTLLAALVGPQPATKTAGAYVEPTRSFAFGAGSDGGLPDRSAYEAALEMLVALEDVSIVAAPGYSARIVTDRPGYLGIQDALLAHVNKPRRYRIGVLDSPPDQTPSTMRELRGFVDSNRAALYYPWIVINNPLSGPSSNRPAEIIVPPSGSVCGIYARNDVTRGVWKAPANEVVQGALRFERNVNFGEQELLNPIGVNCLRYLSGRGFRVWGARTISSDPEWIYVNVRRYFNFLEASIDRGTQWAVFEPNGELLWANIRGTVSDFLFNEWKSGALLGSKPEEAFFVRCDRSTMTQNDLDYGRLVCLIGVAVVKPAEFVIFRIGQKTADAKS